ncbi:hypothetical protein SK854_21535 [Lentzea sp. BCCO 10_0061]|uniref:Uncharacterized protein n=1 Tax=Lentzea sokolovensis TaxID=3095429 RepID=A0ABU4UYU6_9PSEU|nr:hypothetical protein [Lentzea sp. BCCO 10_0061]
MLDDGLRAAMAVKSLPGTVCACLGDVRFEFLGARREVLAVVVFHRGGALAWHGWGGHAILVDEEALLRWLDRKDDLPSCPEWVAAVPPALTWTTRRMLRPVRRTADSSLIAHAHKLLDSADPVTKVLQLLVWRGSGRGEHLHEEIPGLLLRGVPISKIGAALKDSRAAEPHYAGAVRHVLGGDGRERQRLDVARLPRSVRIRLGDAARQAGTEVPQWAIPLLNA